MNVTEEEYLKAKEIIELWNIQKSNLIKSLNEEIEINKKKLAVADGSFRDISLYDLDLSVRLYNNLKSAEIRTLGEIYDIFITNKSYFLTFRNFGKDSMEQLETLLRSHLLIE